MGIDTAVLQPKRVTGLNYFSVSRVIITHLKFTHVRLAKNRADGGCGRQGFGQLSGATTALLTITARCARAKREGFLKLLVEGSRMVDFQIGWPAHDSAWPVVKSA